MPFGVTNGVSCFQRAMDNFIADNQLEGTFAYLDNITVCGRNQEQHDLNLNRFLEAAKANNLVFNRNKWIHHTRITRLNLIILTTIFITNSLHSIVSYNFQSDVTHTAIGEHSTKRRSDTGTTKTVIKNSD